MYGIEPRPVDCRVATGQQACYLGQPNWTSLGRALTMSGVSGALVKRNGRSSYVNGSCCGRALCCYPLELASEISLNEAKREISVWVGLLPSGISPVLIMLITGFSLSLAY